MRQRAEIDASLIDADNGISQGQRQRLFIARAVYKNPEFLFFDEATNSLDANNERIIMDNLKEFYKGKTVVIVAHRLSTAQRENPVFRKKGITRKTCVCNPYFCKPPSML